jgi:hypothetical protein
MRRTLFLALLLTAAAHAQWDLQNSGSTADLRGIHSVGKGIAWASGSNGTVLRTEDGGYLWQRCTVPPGAEKLDFRGIQAFDANTAIVMSSGKGDLSRLYKTTDGCQTWKLVFTNPDKDGFWDALRFETNSQNRNSHIWGILVGDPVAGSFVAYNSKDKGDTWEAMTVKWVKRMPHAKNGESLFAASNSAADAVGDANNLAFVTGGSGGSSLYHLTGGGLILDAFWSWPSFEKTTLPFAHARDSQGAFSVAHRQLDGVTFDFMVVGGDYSHAELSGYAAHIPAATYSWTGRHQTASAAITPPHGYRSAVAYDAATKTWITVGPNGTDISTDDGRNWRALKPGPSDPPDADQHWNALSLPFVVGPHGRIGVLNPVALKAQDVPKTKP